MTRESRTKSDDTADLPLGRSSLVGFGGKVVLASFGFIGIAYFFRELGAAGIGVYYTLVAGTKLAAQFQGGVNKAIMKRVSEVSADQSAYFGVGLLAWLGITVASAIAVVVGSPIVARYVSSTDYLVGCVVMVSSLALFTVLNQFYIGIGNPGKGNWTDAVRSILMLAFQVLFLVIGYNEFGLIGGFVLGNVGTAAVLVFLVKVRPRLPSKEVIQRTAAFAKWSVPNGFVNNVYSRLDVLFLWWFVGPAAVGLYEPALRMTVPATFVAASISQSLAVKSSGLDSQNRSVVEDLRNSLKYAGLIAIPIFFGALSIPEVLMGTIFGPSATAAAVALIGLAMFQFLNSYWKVLSSVIDGVDRPDLKVKLGAVTVVFNIPIAIVLVQAYGLEGIVAATVLAELFRLVIGWGIIIKLFGNPGLPRETVQQLFAGVVMFVVIEGITTAIVSVTSLFWLALVVGSGAVVYFTVLAGVSHHFRHTTRIVIGETISL